MLSNVLVLIASYLLGSIPFSYLIAKLVAHVDIRNEGEGNVGSRNVMHVAGRVPGVIAGLLDIGKGAAVYFVARQFGTGTLILYGAALALVIGHGFPIWLHFKGGKGLAASGGFLACVYPWAVLGGLAVVVIARLLTRDFNISVAIATVSFAGFSVLEGKDFTGIVLIALLFGMTGVKKLVDLPHERAIRAKSGWIEGRRRPTHTNGSDADVGSRR